MGRIEELVAERVPGDRADAVGAFADAYLRREGRAAELDGGPGAEALFHELLGAFELAAGRDGAPIAVRALNPTRAEHGYEPVGSVLETNTEDLPFLVDSVSAELHARGLSIVRLLHPIVGTERGPDGRIARVLHPAGAPAVESVMHFELDRHLSPEELADLEDAVRGVLADVRRVVRDFDAMRERLDEMTALARAGAPRYDADEVDEAVAFLRWIAEGNFIFLGAREYAIADDALGVVPDSGLGLLAGEDRSRYARPVALGELDPGLRDRVLDGELLILSRTNARSPVHRRERMDYVGVRRIAADGSTAGESRMLGLFTTKAWAEPASETPMLGRKLRRILAAEDLIEGSHDFKAAISVFDSFPKEELLTASTEDLRRAIVALLALQGDQVAVLGRRDPDGRGASVIVALPKARWEPSVLERMGALLTERFGAELVEAHEVLGEESRVRVHFSVHEPGGGVREVDLPALQAEIEEITRTWDDRVRERLAAGHGGERGRMLAQRWARRLPPSYKAAVAPEAGALDIANFERLFAGGEPFLVGLRNEPASDGALLTRIGLYRLGGKVELSRVMPILEDLGLRVIEERPTRLRDGGGETWLQDFGVLGPDDAPLDCGALGPRVAETIAAVWRGEAESDSLNRLVVTTGLDWPRLSILRAYRRYRQRIGSRFTEGYQHDVLAANAAITAKMMELFERRFDPARPRDEDAERALLDEILADLDAVPSLDHDRILRNQLGLIEATVRTNAFRRGRRALAFKLRSADVPAIPQPAPLFEIYVHSPEVEGIHLRGGRIARGGLRWSDRMDYRTEVFGLMRAQTTKNAVIVPDGAKGGFYLRRPPGDPAQLRAEVERQYVVYISGLLDVTDNLVDGEVVHPEAVRVLDEDDTYLVVAADKGTATFSDTANRIAGRYGFWLGDAFASGGSNGYDHKALGITARGAWESLRRHFRDLDRDPSVDVFTAVGIGDMSGDVFGNGMLLSDRIKLVAAYDHRHLFVDPDPDPKASFAERRRLFELERSSWDDYDRDALSEGGGIWSRSAKAITLSERARAALGLADDEGAGPLDPTEVIRAILRAPVDVLWNGGIGTVVKASTESDADAQDRSSDAIRVDAAQVRAKVVAEGGNLGLTQRARVEFARAGGLVFADFIDNSAGVDCSDHEVNLKILLDVAVRRGELDDDGRAALLREVTEDVAQHVLYDSFLQAQILAQEVRASAGRMFAYEDLMQALEGAGLLDRTVEALPDGEEVAERRRAGEGLERPELAVLLADAKRALTGALLDSELPDDPWFEHDLRGYFPPAVVERFAPLLTEHPLRRELVATLLANGVVNALGPTFVSRLTAERGAEAPAVVRAFRIARDVIDADRRWEAVEHLDRAVDRSVQWQLMDQLDWLVEGLSRWYLAHDAGEPLGETIGAGREGFEQLRAVLPALGSQPWREAREQAAAELGQAGVPTELARDHAFGRRLIHVPDVLAVARASGREVQDTGRAFSAVGDALRLEWLEGEIESLPVGTRTQRWAQQAARDDVIELRRALAEQALREAPEEDVDTAVERFVTARGPALERLGRLVRSLGLEGGTDLAGVTLTVRQLRALVR